ncbi:MAG: hypothetical protein JJT78_18660 [Leptospira sp.]|nr:hypothetical protein [Leptospira sp.]
MKAIFLLIKLFSILALTVSCIQEEHPDLKYALNKAITENIDNFVIINISNLNSEKYKKSSLDDQVFLIISEVEKFKPKLIFLDTILDKQMTEENIKSLRSKNFQLVSLYRLKNQENVDVVEDYKSILGSKISGYSRFEDENSLRYNSIELPNSNLVRFSDKLCTYFFGQNPSTKLIEYMLPIYQYGDYFLESCSLVIANILLDKYGINLSYSSFYRRYQMFSYIKNQFGSIKYLDNFKFTREPYKEINFKEFPEYFSIEEMKTSEIPENAVFIISKNAKFKIPNGEMGSAQLIASEVYTLINALSTPMTYFNKIDKRVIYAEE